MVDLKVKKKFYTLLHGLMKEYHPESMERFTEDVSTVEPEDYVDANEMLDIVNELSLDATEVLGKESIRVINETTDIFKSAKVLTNVLNLLPLIMASNCKGKDLGGYKVLKNEEGYFEFEDTCGWPDGIGRGLTLGILGIFKTRVANKVTVINGDIRTHKISYAH